MRALAGLAVLALAALAMAGLAALPDGAPAGLYEQARVELTSSPSPRDGTRVAPGHAAFAEVAGPDPGLALRVGLARAPRVLGVPLGDAPARVLAVPAEAPTDLAGLAPTGEAFSFTDPNGRAWTVVEYAAPWGHAYGTLVGPDTHDPHAGLYNFVLLVDTARLPGAVRVVAA